MSKTGKFQYKCRLCGEVYTEGETSAKNANIHLVGIIYGCFKGTMPQMVDIHACCKAGYGIADLQGVIFLEEAESHANLNVPDVPILRKDLDNCRCCEKCGKLFGSEEEEKTHVCEACYGN